MSHFHKYYVFKHLIAPLAYLNFLYLFMYCHIYILFNVHCHLCVCLFPALCDQIQSEETTVIIFDALAGHLHQVQVRARDEVNNESQWSEWSPLLLALPWSGQEDISQHSHTMTPHIQYL